MHFGFQIISDGLCSYLFVRKQTHDLKLDFMLAAYSQKVKEVIRSRSQFDMYRNSRGNFARWFPKQRLRLRDLYISS